MRAQARSPANAAPPHERSARLSRGGALTLAVNAGTRQLRVWAYVSDGESIELDGQPGLEWRSSNTAVATVDARGLLTPLSPGTTQVTARLDAVTSAPPTVVTITPPGG